VDNNQFAICKSANDCSVLLPELTDDGKYLMEIPADPTNESEIYSGYNVLLDEEHQNRLAVCAPRAEGGEVIYIER
jgi:hypothetical protein